MTRRRRQEPWITKLWPDERKGPWAVRLRFEVVDGRRECVRLEITQPGEREPITTSVVRAIPVASIIDNARKELTRNLRAPRKRGPRERAPRVPPGRRPLDDELLRAVADVYEGAWKSGDHPTKAVGEHFGRPYATAARWIMRSRREGFLPPTTRGKPGAPRGE